jgi:hypothetical protein
MSSWIQEEFSLFPQDSSRIGHACADYSWDDRLLPPSSWKFPICTLSHWLIYSRKRKFQEPQYLLSCFPTKTRWCSIAISYCWCNSLLAVAIAILLIFLEIYAIVNILRIQQHPLSDIHRNYLLRHTKSAVWLHLTRAEPQATMMVGILQGFDIGLFENPAMLMLWWTQLAGRPIDILPWFLKNSHSPWGFHVTYSRSCPLWYLFPILKSDLYLMTNWRLVISLILVSVALASSF